MPASLRWAPADPRHHRRPSNTSRQFWLSLLWSLCPFPLSLGACKVLCVPAKTGVPVSPSPVEVLQSNPPGLQGQIPCLSVGTPGWVAWLWVLNLHNSARTSLVLLFSSLGSPIRQAWDVMLSWLYSYHLAAAFSLSLYVGYLFLVGSSILLLVVQQLVVILVLTGGDGCMSLKVFLL